MVNTKTTAVRLIPAIGKSAGEELNFGGLLGRGPVMPVRKGSRRHLLSVAEEFRLRFRRLKLISHGVVLWRI